MLELQVSVPDGLADFYESATYLSPNPRVTAERGDSPSKGDWVL